MSEKKAFPRRLKIKLMVIVSVTFLALIVPGISLLLFTTSNTDEEMLASRIGSLSSRAALAIERQKAYNTPAIATELLDALASDRAFICAELYEKNAPPVAKLPRRQGCLDDLDGSEINLPASEDGTWQLRVRFSNAELRDMRHSEFIFGATAISVAFLATLLAVAASSHFLVDKPLMRLLKSIRNTSVTGRRQTVDWSGNDEMAQVIDAYNTMVRQEQQRKQVLEATNEELHRSQRELSTLNRELEDRVQERTRELEFAKRTAEMANASKTRFLRAMSHELRTPLNAIIGFSDIMAHGTLGPIENARYREFSVDIRDSGRHLLNIINELLDIARIEAGQGSLEWEIVSVDALVTDAIRVVTPLADERNISLKHAPIDPELVLQADSTKMKQVLLNILSNAIKYTPKGGTVSLTVEVRQKDDTVHQGRIEFHITDTGKGIPRDQIPRAMAAFERLDDDMTAAQGGTGLGLPLAQMMVELHGGRLVMESEVGVGTTVSFWLPGNRVGLLRDVASDFRAKSA